MVHLPNEPQFRRCRETVQHDVLVNLVRYLLPQHLEAKLEVPEWEAAANREMTSLQERKVYKLAPRKAVPPGRKRIKSKWVMKRKADKSYKARL